MTEQTHTDAMKELVCKDCHFWKGDNSLTIFYKKWTQADYDRYVYFGTCLCEIPPPPNTSKFQMKINWGRDPSRKPVHIKTGWCKDACRNFKARDSSFDKQQIDMENLWVDLSS